MKSPNLSSHPIKQSCRVDAPVDGARLMLQRGFKPFPVRPKRKEPAVNGWQAWAETASDKMLCDHALDTRDSNWGIFPALSGHMVLDIDSGYKLRSKGIVKANGDKTLKSLEEKYGKLPKTFTVRTPSGGSHLYFRGTCRPTQSAVGEGIDTRSIGSYVVAPGSITTCYTANGKKIEGAYAIIEDCEPVECPIWLLDLIEAEKPKSNLLLANMPTPTIDMLDTPLNVNEAVEFLQSAPICEEGAGQHGGEYLLNIAMQLRDRGITKEIAKELILTHYNDRCNPPWDMNDSAHQKHFMAKIENAYTYAKNPMGVLSPEVKLAQAKQEFSEIPEEQSAVPDLFPLHWVKDINPSETPKRKWIMQGRYAAGVVTSIIAPGGVGKSLLTMTDTVAIGTGKAISGFEVQQGRVWLHNLEDDLMELRRRFEAICKHHKLPLSSLSNIAFTSGMDFPLILAKRVRGEARENTKTVDQIISTIRKYDISILFLDPFSRCYSVNENDNTEMNIVMNAQSRIAKEAGCAICIVHHSSKAGAHKDSDPSNQDNSRGASAITNAVRCSQTVAGMTEKEAVSYKVPPEDRHLYLKLVDAKANLIVKKSDCTWYKKIPVTLTNGEIIPAIELANLSGEAEVREQIEKADQKEEALKFLRAHVKEGESVALGLLVKSAKQEEIHAFQGKCTKITRPAQILTTMLFDIREFTIGKGKGNKWMISREDSI